MYSKYLTVLQLFFYYDLSFFLAFAFDPIHPSNRVNPIPQHDRRVFFREAAIMTGGMLPLPLSPTRAVAFMSNPRPDAISTLVLDSPSSRAGIQLTDVQVGVKLFSAVKSIGPEGEASKSGIEVGMVVVGKNSSKDVVNQIKNGPYPVVLQFYNPAAETGAKTAAEGLQMAQSSEALSAVAPAGPPKLSYSGAGLSTTVIRKGDDCRLRVRRGDTVKVNYIARIASPGGPIYDSTQERGGPVVFTVGDGKAINGVDSGIGGMCKGEIQRA